MTNYEYKFVEVPAQEAGKEDASPFKICAQIITAESKAGWRLKQIVTALGVSYLVILEKEAN